MTLSLTLVAQVYVAIGALFSLWLVVMASYQLDKFDRQYLNKSVAVAILVLCIVGWPLALMYRPKALVSVRALAPIDYRSAAFMRERFRLSQALPYCASRVSFSPTKGGVKIARHLFSAADIESTAAKPIKRYWRSLAEESEIIRWVRTANLSDDSPVEVPWVWTGFALLADDMLRQGLGETHCIACDQRYSATVLQPEDDYAAADSVHKRLLCPKGHTVLEIQSKKPQY
jgi:hypothetical protein